MTNVKENPKVFGALNKVNYELKDLFDKKKISYKELSTIF